MTSDETFAAAERAVADLLAEGAEPQHLATALFVVALKMTVEAIGWAGAAAALERQLRTATAYAEDERPEVLQ